MLMPTISKFYGFHINGFLPHTHRCAAIKDVDKREINSYENRTDKFPISFGQSQIEKNDAEKHEKHACKELHEDEAGKTSMQRWKPFMTILRSMTAEE